MERDLNLYQGPDDTLGYSYSCNDCVVTVEGTLVSDISKKDVGKMLSDIAKVKFKLGKAPSYRTMLSRNKDLVDRIMDDLAKDQKNQ